MNLKLLRGSTEDDATIGALFANGHFECLMLEDAIREVPGLPVSAWKIKGQTAIPAGRYHIVVTPSQRFGRRLPLLLGVPGFEGIRIHPGNTKADTDGCLLPGKSRKGSTLLHSRMAFERLYALIETSSDPAWIDIQNPVTSGDAAKEQ